jgi:threonine dehydrogenase-like Zn-dependent dehydrogenase
MSNLLNPAIPIDLEPDYKPREDGSKMLALVWQGKTNVKLQEVDVPDVTQPVSLPYPMPASWYSFSSPRVICFGRGCA